MTRSSMLQCLIIGLALTFVMLGLMGSGCPSSSSDGDDDDSGDGGDDDGGDDDGCPDEDGDGYGSCEECDDTDSAINPAAEEIADGLDNNCDGSVDEGLDDDTDDDSDDDSDDDTAECTVTDVCTFLIDDCDLGGIYGTVTDCETSFTYCELDPEGYVECSCDCATADPECTSAETAQSCVTDCYVDNCY